MGCVFSLIWSFIFVFVGNNGITGGRGGSALTRPKKVMKTTLCHGPAVASAASAGPGRIWFPFGTTDFLEATMKVMGNTPEKTHIPTRVCWAVRASGEHSRTLEQEASFLGESIADQNLGDSEDKEACPASITERLAHTGCRQRGLSKLGSGRRKHVGDCERARDAQLLQPQGTSGGPGLSGPHQTLTLHGRCTKGLGGTLHIPPAIFTSLHTA